MWKQVWAAGFVVALSGCLGKSENEVVVYTALDREFSEPIFDDFQRDTGIKVLAKYDVESTKTVGLVNEIIHEKNRPRCDVFWNNEILHTLRLQRLGLLDEYPAPAATSFPQQYKAADGSWYGLAARARILIVNSDMVDQAEMPDRIEDLTATKWKGRVGIAKPLFGTTATHAAVLFAHWGEQRATAFFEQVHNNAKVMSGNKQVALAVARGDLAFGITDTDDAIVEIDKGHPVTIVFPDQGDDGLGTLFIPNTLALIKGSPNSDTRQKLVDYLLSNAVEEKLAKGSSAQFPLNRGVTVKSRVQPDSPVKHMPADFAAAAEGWDDAAKILRTLFAAGQ